MKKLLLLIAVLFLMWNVYAKEMYYAEHFWIERRLAKRIDDKMKTMTIKEVDEVFVKTKEIKKRYQRASKIHAVMRFIEFFRYRMVNMYWFPKEKVYWGVEEEVWADKQKLNSCWYNREETWDLRWAYREFIWYERWDYKCVKINYKCSKRRVSVWFEVDHMFWNKREWNWVVHDISQFASTCEEAIKKKPKGITSIIFMSKNFEY